ncbi:ABC transporter permease [Mucilaginibacter sp. L3T2-6]|uniref:ABC transporter permease n=1 Tax=Mucilaginibacter sp. L3T2-6 TaxID=3062491 RepID=UPI0026763EF0|nr:ABC transporter permease [Mucilaginibacter sp. L3T2-6]MDO3643991.1 ABC transporter permease [Mucilaginibacter sp. L3T2-6]MDV6216442.1 ABC transporter permease [Mucilaginibacter sp. L3T2-6]
MIFNYIKIAWRNLVKQRLFSLINITGLAIGLAVCMMIMMYVAHENSYDRFHTNADRIFSPRAAFKIGASTMNLAHTSFDAAAIIKERQPVVKDFVRTMAYFKPVIVSNPERPETKYSESKLLFADNNFFNFFSFKLVSGNASNVLAHPFNVVLSQEMARKYFGNENPVGKTITLKTDSAFTYQITGVAENTPSNSSIEFSFVTSNQSLLQMKEAALYTGAKGQISFGNFDNYILLNKASDTTSLSRSLDLMAKKDKTFDGVHYTFVSMPDMHLKSNFGDSSNTKYLKIFPLVAILVLILALVNYMSLSTARATLRAKEVGVRKVAGASRKTIATQFYVESAMFAIISFVLGYVLCYGFKSWFLNILQLKIDDTFLYSPTVLILLFALLLLTILIAGSYPSLVLSAFKPVTTLKGKMSKSSGGVAVRKVFTTLQFSISVGLIVCGIVIDRQLYYFRHVDTGINRDNVVMIPVHNTFGSNYLAFKQDIKSLSGIESAATTHYEMFKGFDMNSFNGKTKEENIMLVSLLGDDQYIKTLGLKWRYAPVAGEKLAGMDRIVINEAAIEKLHLPANPIGSYVKSGPQQYKVTGVLKNFNYSSLQSEIAPLVLNVVPDNMLFSPRDGCTLLARIKPHTNIPTLLSKMEAIYKKYDKDTPFDYTFADDAFNQQYKAEDRLASIFSVFTYITIMLATLGLFGLAAFTIEQRTKEIGIRKVLGASLASINTLLSRDFLALVLLSILIASPVAWWAMHKWLEGFAYRITISWWMFAAAGIVAVATAIITVSYHAIKAAVANPVDSLRAE